MFWDYLTSRRYWMGLALSSWLALILVFSAFQLPWKPILYLWILILVNSLVFVSMDYRRWRESVKRLEALRNLHQHTEIAAMDKQEEVCVQSIALLKAQWMEEDSKIAKRLSDLEDYYGIWAHQIKTPIAATKLLLQEDELRPSLLKGEIFKIEEYVEMLLGYLRLDSPSTDYVFHEQSLDAIIRKSIRKYAPLFIQKKLKMDYQHVDVRLITDEKWFSFLLEQLLSNALKYTSEGWIRIQWQGDGLIISDTGIGIAAEDLPRIFEMGYTGYNGRIGRQSTGIGLALVQRIAEELSLKVSVDSRLGEGTRVKIQIPSEQWKG